MTCPKCKTANPDSASFCMGCGNPMKPAGAGETPDEVTYAWLREVLAGDRYEVKEVDDWGLLAKHSERPNIHVRLRPKLNLITIQHFWSVKKARWGGQKGLLNAVNEANSISWVDTFAVDKDGDLNVSNYILLATRLSERDILRFIETESELFVKIITTTSLKDYIK